MTASVLREGQQLRLQGTLDFASAPALRDELTSAIIASAGQPLTLDLSAVSHSNSVGLSLLLSAVRAAREHKISLQVAGLPAGLLSMAGVCGLDDWLNTLSADPFSNKEIPHAAPGS